MQSLMQRHERKHIGEFTEVVAPIHLLNPSRRRDHTNWCGSDIVHFGIRGRWSHWNRACSLWSNAGTICPPRQHQVCRNHLGSLAAMRKSIWAAIPSAALFCYTEANIANSWSRDVKSWWTPWWGWMPTRTGRCCNCYRWVKKSNPVLEAVAHGLPCQYAQLGLLRILLQASSISCSCLSTRWFQPNFPDYHVKEFHRLKCMSVCVCVKLINSTSCQFDHDLCLSSRAFSGIGCIDTSPRIESSPCHSQRACRHRVLQKHLTRHTWVQGVYFQLMIHMCHAQNMAYGPYGSIWGIVVPLLGILSM